MTTTDTPPPSDFSWANFVRAHANDAPTPLVRAAVAAVHTRGTAIEIGCGGLTDTYYLLEADFDTVIGLDAEPEVAVLAAKHGVPGIDIVISDFLDYDFGTERFDLVLARHCLFFATGDDFYDLIAAIQTSLKLGGIFAFTLVGPEDTWNTPDASITFTDRDTIHHMRTGWETVSFWEKIQYSPSFVDEQKRWHLYGLILRKQ